MKLRGAKLLLWRKDLKRKKGVPAMAPDLAFVSRYVCTGCEKVFYYKTGDAETPQYFTRKNYKPPKGSIFGQADPYCHRCWHKFGLESPLYRSGCWLCVLKRARQASPNGHVRNTGSLETLTPLVGSQSVPPEPVPEKRKRRRVSRRVGLSSGR